jgi:Uma2 family endonuclease
MRKKRGVHMKPIHGKADYTVADYMDWPENERWELIDGVASLLPTPYLNHQVLLGEIGGGLLNALKNTPFKIFLRPLDVYLGNADNTVVQPDVLAVCDATKIHHKGIVGAPDLILEILSPWTAGYDCLQKYQLYRREGVKEYWIVSPEEKKVFQNIWEAGKYVTEIHSTGMLRTFLFPDYALDVNALFASLKYFPE